MRIEFIRQTITLTNEQIHEQLPALLAMINSSLQQKKAPKRRKPRKKKEKIGPLIQEIIDSIE
jgi:hypothetical protein